jgi:hypothetical protein
MTRTERHRAEVRWHATLRREWQRRREQCRHDLEAARVRGDLVRYRRHLARWNRFFVVERGG